MNGENPTVTDIKTQAHEILQEIPDDKVAPVIEILIGNL